MNKDEKLQITKEKLIAATLELMETLDDPMKVTSREIAARADVQPGMINYCFGSRENLIYATFHQEYLHFFNEDDVEKLLTSNLSPKDLLKKIHFIVARCLIQNYKFTQAISGFVLFKRDLGQESFSYPYVQEHYGNRKSEKECKLIAYELSTMMQLIIYRKDDIKKDFGIDLEQDDVLQKYVEMRVDLLLGD
ncbi:MAG: TetR/AcrR family transcriptional regulator [Lachnospiraceae bacterium]|nr:TetR/AcrR family transcriptional regulator [Clostridiales bacterium]MBR6850907.1 TetR/AcrR family transcriptional regulator [Lachnospiraceae bacterium]